MDIIILGAGVGGVSAAITLVKQGHQVRIFERTEMPAQIGAGVVLWPNASFVLQEMGLLQAIQQYSGQPLGMQRLDKEGEPLGSLDIELLNREMGLASYSIFRRDLQAVLIQGLQDLGIEIEFNHTALEILSTKDNGARVVFSSGLVLQADLIIGADGRMRSVARKFVNGDNAPVYQGFINWIGITDFSNPVFTQQQVFDYWGIGERFGIVPIDEQRCYWAGGQASTQIEASQLSPREELLQIFHNWPAPIAEIIRGAEHSAMNKIYVHDHDPIDVWHRDNVLLLGDSAHAPLPTSGQGACQALEDGWHMARLLQQNANDIQQTCQQFTQLRKEKTRNITYAARGLASSLFNSDAAYCEKRNQNSLETDYDAMARGMATGWGEGLPLSV